MYQVLGHSGFLVILFYHLSQCILLPILQLTNMGSNYLFSTIEKGKQNYNVNSDVFWGQVRSLSHIWAKKTMPSLHLALYLFKYIPVSGLLWIYMLPNVLKVLSLCMRIIFYYSLDTAKKSINIICSIIFITLHKAFTNNKQSKHYICWSNLSRLLTKNMQIL